MARTGIQEKKKTLSTPEQLRRQISKHASVVVAGMMRVLRATGAEKEGKGADRIDRGGGV